MNYLNGINKLSVTFKIQNLRFIRSETECLTGFEMLLFEASQVNNRPLSERSRLSNITLEVTVEPDETSDDVPRGIPLCSQRTRGFGRPKKICYY